MSLTYEGKTPKIAANVFISDRAARPRGTVKYA